MWCAEAKYKNCVTVKILWSGQLLLRSILSRVWWNWLNRLPRRHTWNILPNLSMTQSSMNFSSSKETDYLTKQFISKPLYAINVACPRLLLNKTLQIPWGLWGRYKVSAKAMTQRVSVMFTLGVPRNPTQSRCTALDAKSPRVPSWLQGGGKL